MLDVPVSDEYESPFPECRVLATADPHALVRFDMNRDQVAVFGKQVRDALDDHDGDGLVTIGFTVGEPVYRRFAEQIDRLVSLSDQGDSLLAAQVLVDGSLDPSDPEGVSVAVILNEEQVRGIQERAESALAVSNGNLHRWEYSVSPGGARMLVQQIAAALRGADEPLEHVDVEDGGRNE